MIREFEDLSLRIGDYRVLAASGTVELEVADGDVRVKSITLDSELPGPTDGLKLEWAAGKNINEAWLYALLAPALMERFRDDLQRLTYGGGWRRSRPAS